MTLSEAERQRLELALPGKEPRPPPTVTVVPAVPPAAPSPPAAAPEMTRASSDAPASPARPLRRAAYVSAGLGVAAAGAALGVYLWNRGRYAGLAAGTRPSRTRPVGSDRLPDAVAKNNDLAASLTSADKAILGLSIAGGLLLARGATLWLVDRDARARAGELAFSWTGSSAALGWSSRGETPRARGDGDLVCALAAPGCFDARLRDPGPLIIDDFEDGNLTPELTTFDSWGCYAYNTPEAPIGCALAPGRPGSMFALTLDFSVDDPPDGKQQLGGASLAVYDQATLDLRPATEDFVFTAQVASGKTPRCPATPGSTQSSGAAPRSPGTAPSWRTSTVLSSAAFKPDWQTFRIDVASLGFPPWVINDVKGGPARCRQLVDSIRFTIDAFLVDGQSGEGILSVDDVYLE